MRGEQYYSVDTFFHWLSYAKPSLLGNLSTYGQTPYKRRTGQKTNRGQVIIYKGIEEDEPLVPCWLGQSAGGRHKTSRGVMLCNSA